MTDLFGEVIKLERTVVMGKDYVVAEILIPKSLSFIGRERDEQIRFEDIHFGRVRLIQDDWRADV